MTLDKIEPLMRHINKAAKFIGFQWAGVTNEDDSKQSISLHLLERPGSVDKILNMDDKAQYRAIVGIGHQIASAERADYDIYKGSYRYNVAEVKSVLELGVLTEGIDGWDEAVHDLMEALEALTVKAPQYQDAILKRYADFETPSDKAEKNALNRGLSALVEEMNKSNKRRFSERDDGVGSRKSVSNGYASELTHESWAGEEMSGEFIR